MEKIKSTLIQIKMFKTSAENYAPASYAFVKARARNPPVHICNGTKLYTNSKVIPNAYTAREASNGRKH